MAKKTVRKERVIPVPRELTWEIRFRDQDKPPIEHSAHHVNWYNNNFEFVRRYPDNDSVSTLMISGDLVEHVKLLRRDESEAEPDAG